MCRHFFPPDWIEYTNRCARKSVSKIFINFFLLRLMFDLINTSLFCTAFRIVSFCFLLLLGSFMVFSRGQRRYSYLQSRIPKEMSFMLLEARHTSHFFDFRFFFSYPPHFENQSIKLVFLVHCSYFVERISLYLFYIDNGNF